MRRVEELCHMADQKGIPRYTGFLSDREQALALAAMNRAQCRFGEFRGGWPGAERRVPAQHDFPRDGRLHQKLS